MLCGDQQSDLDLARAIEAELQIHVERFDPFSGVKLGSALVASPLKHPGRFAPLVGMLLAELKPSNHAVDFLHPRRRAAAADPRKKWIIAAACAATLLLGGLIYSRIEHYLLAESVAAKTEERNRLDKDVESTKTIRSDAAEIGKWANEDANWLDRINELQQSFPPGENAVLGNLTVPPSHAGQIVLKGWVRQQDDIARLEESIRAHGNRMSVTSSKEDHTVQPYSWLFEASVVLPKKGEKP